MKTFDPSFRSQVSFGLVASVLTLVTFTPRMLAQDCCGPPPMEVNCGAKITSAPTAFGPLTGDGNGDYFAVVACQAMFTCGNAAQSKCLVCATDTVTQETNANAPGGPTFIIFTPVTAQSSTQPCASSNTFSTNFTTSHMKSGYEYNITVEYGSSCAPNDVQGQYTQSMAYYPS